MRRFIHAAAFGLLLCCLFGAPARCAAEQADKSAEGPSLVSYGMDGFWVGAQAGLAAGYLSTGRTYETHEWRNLVLGAGIGALTGTGLGLVLGVVDASAEPKPGMGWYVIRDAGYGTTLGALVGLAVGALMLANSSNAKDLVTGAAYGALIGTGSGVVFGLIEGAGAKRLTPAPSDARAPDDASALHLQFAVLSVPARGTSLMPGVRGSFRGL